MNSKSENHYDKDAVKAWLLEFREREKDIQEQLNRLDIIDMRITSLASPTISDMPKSTSPYQDRSAFLIATKVDLENDIKQQQEEQLRTRKEIEIVIKKLKKSEERSVIRARYLDCSFYHEDKLCDWNDVNSTLFGGREDFLDREDSYLRRVHKIHGAALFNLSYYIDELRTIFS